MSRRAKIIATLGPATESPERLTALLEAGVDVARLNFSHGTPQEHAGRMEAVRQAAQRVGRPVAILQDLQGPKLRTGKTVDGLPIHLEPGASVRLTAGSGPSTPHSICIDYPGLARELRPGTRVLLRDGELELRVVRVDGEEVVSEVIAGGVLGPEAGVHFPGLRLSAETLTEKDLADLRFGLEHGIDAVALSFVRRADDVRAVRKAIAQQVPGPLRPWVIAKIERAEALDELPGILAEADGVLVARGDLDLEVSAERRPLPSETDHPGSKRRRQAGDHRHPDARVDDPRFPPDTRRSLRRSQRRVRRLGRVDAVGRDGRRRIPGGSDSDDGPDHPRCRTQSHAAPSR